MTAPATPMAEATLPSAGVLADAVADALTEEMVSRLLQRAEALFRLLSDPNVREIGEALGSALPALARFARRLAQLTDAGALDRAADLLGLSLALTDALTPAQAERAAAQLADAAEAAGALLALRPAGGLAAAGEALRRALRRSEAPPPSLIGLLRQAARDRGVRRLLAAGFHLLSDLGQALE